MKKIRVYELSKKVGLSNKELIDHLKNELDVDVKSHSSSVEESVAQEVLKAFKVDENEKSKGKKEEKPSRTKKTAEAAEKAPEKPSKRKGTATRESTGESQAGSRKGKGRRNRRSKDNGPATATIHERLKKSDESSKPVLQTKTFPRPMERGRRGRRDRKSRPPEVTKKESQQKWMTLPETLTVSELAEKLGVSASELIKLLMKQGLMANINQVLDFENAAQIVKKFGFKVELEKEEKPILPQEKDEEEDLVTRPPVVTVLGHVDHGKTSLLDAIRNTKVAAGESGGITQKIGAYTVKKDGREIVFVDTPGHEAFTAMRARGAQVTDVAILVVAADDGVMPQTIEAIDHARAARVPIIVAINKIDKNNANPERVKQQLAEHDLIPEDWGGDTVTVPVSAHTKDGIDELLEMITLVAEMQELKGNPDRNAIGSVIESSLDKGFGPVATVIIQNGTLKVGDPVVVGNEYGKIRFMINDKGKRVKAVGPSYPVEVTGLSGIPSAGDRLMVLEEEKDAKTISDERKLEHRTDRLQSDARVSLDDLFSQMKKGEIKDLNIIIKTDSNGSLEALKHSLTKLAHEEVRINVIHGGVGAITESDVVLAAASNAIIIGFNVRPDAKAKRKAVQEQIDVRLYRVIYHIIEDIKDAMSGLLEPEYEEVFLGRAEVRAIFKISRIGVIAGSYVQEGKLVRNASVRVIRDNVVIYEDKIDTLQRFKDQVTEVSAGYECGIHISKFPGIQPGDILEAYTLKEVKRELDLPG
ncbi:MAG: translation initiation factor IF-2 [Vulcanimicrobiota bacterium]